MNVIYYYPEIGKTIKWDIEPHIINRLEKSGKLNDYKLKELKIQYLSDKIFMKSKEINLFLVTDKSLEMNGLVADMLIIDENVFREFDYNKIEEIIKKFYIRVRKPNKTLTECTKIMAEAKELTLKKLWNEFSTDKYL
jgi:hypothetical protein